MKELEIDGLSLDYIQEQIKEKEDKEVKEKEIINAIEEMLKDCDDSLIKLIIQYL